MLGEQPDLVTRVRARARTLRSGLRAAGLPVREGEMPIVPLIVGEPDAAVAARDRALRDGVFVQAIRPPTVPAGTSRLRVVATAAHTESELTHASECLAHALAARVPSEDPDDPRRKPVRAG
jgi:glycine C-acetyltransferase/8-amino-7-oxononanoate synthase